ncbi:MAG: type II secretion system protein [Planctomycetes bacterium]|nr:type II secretion system protein [Planctomycetota bacterium]
MPIKRSAFTLVEIMVAIAIFATSVLILIERRNASMEASYYASSILEAQEIIDEVMALYRLHPFSKEPIPLEKDYEPFKVEVSVNEESINIIPEEWRIEELDYGEEDEDGKKERIILRVTVKISFDHLTSPKEQYEYEISTLIRHIEINEDEDDYNSSSSNSNSRNSNSSNNRNSRSNNNRNSR